MKYCQPAEGNISCTYFEDLKLINTQWDSLLPENHPLQSRFLLAFQNAALPDLKLHYILISRNETLIGCAFFQHFQFHAGHYDSKAIGQGPIFYLSQLLLCRQTGILVCGNLFQQGSEGFYFPDPSNRNCILAVAEQMNRKWKPGAVLLKDIKEKFLADSSNTGGFRFFGDDLMMNMQIPETWKNFDNYLLALGKKYRQRAGRILQSAASLGLRELSLTEILERAGEIEGLYNQVRESQALRIGSLNAAYFLEMKKVHNQNFQIRAWFDTEGKMLAFASHFLHPGSEREVHYIGFDYASNEKHFLYFNILFDGIRAAIEAGNKKLLFGRTGFDAKASAGAVAESAIHYLRIKRGLPSLTFRILRTALAGKENDGWKNRHPFKSSAMPTELLEV